MMLSDNGSIVLFTPETAEERAWIEENVAPEGWQWFGGALVVEARFAGALADGMINEGIAVTS